MTVGPHDKPLAWTSTTRRRIPGLFLPQKFATYSITNGCASSCKTNSFVFNYQTKNQMAARPTAKPTALYSMNKRRIPKLFLPFGLWWPKYLGWAWRTPLQVRFELPRSDIVMFRNELSRQAVLSGVSCANAALSDTWSNWIREKRNYHGAHLELMRRARRFHD